MCVGGCVVCVCIWGWVGGCMGVCVCVGEWVVMCVWVGVWRWGGDQCGVYVGGAYVRVNIF